VQIVVNPPLPTATALPSATPAPILVYITGAVINPETTAELPEGSRVQDAVDVAGGFTDDADLERLNPVAVLRDGDQIHVFSVNDTDESEQVVATPSGGSVINVNNATLEELTTLPGVGPALAQAIIDFREANGSFANLAALDEVSGIGPSILESLADLVTFEQ